MDGPREGVEDTYQAAFDPVIYAAGRISDTGEKGVRRKGVPIMDKSEYGRLRGLCVARVVNGADGNKRCFCTQTEQPEMPSCHACYSRAFNAFAYPQPISASTSAIILRVRTPGIVATTPSAEVLARERDRIV